MCAVEQVSKEGTLQSFNRYSRIRVSPMAGPIGAEVSCGDVKALNEQTIAEIRQAWLDHLVLLFRGQEINDDELLTFSRQFGESERSPATSGNQHARANPHISVISNVLENGIPIGSLGDGEAIWHTDMSNREIPPNGSMLYALEVPPLGGETGFLNMYHALDTLPKELRARIEGRTILHDGKYNSAGVKRRVVIEASHPMVRTHPETKRNALYLGRRPHSVINGLPAHESETLLDALWAHATRPQFALHHRWNAGDIVIWDNRCCLHHRNAFDSGARRIMHRAQMVGSRPVTDPNSSLMAPHPRSSLGAQS